MSVLSSSHADLLSKTSHDHHGHRLVPSTTWLHIEGSAFVMYHSAEHLKFLSMRNNHAQHGAG